MHSSGSGRIGLSRPQTAAAAVSKFSEWGIDQACICSTRSLFVHWEDGNREVESTAQQHPASLIPFACLGTFETSHHAADRKHDLKAYRERGFRGIRLYPQHHSYSLLFETFIDEICEQAQSAESARAVVAARDYELGCSKP